MSREQPGRRTRSVLGHLGMGVLGLIGGVLAVSVFDDLLAGIVITVTRYRRVTA